MSEREGNDSGKRTTGKTASRGDVWPLPIRHLGFENVRKGDGWEVGQIRAHSKPRFLAIINSLNA